MAIEFDLTTTFLLSLTAASSVATNIIVLIDLPKIGVLLSRVDDRLSYFRDDFLDYAFGDDDGDDEDDAPDMIALLDGWGAEQREG